MLFTDRYSAKTEPIIRTTNTDTDASTSVYYFVYCNNTEYRQLNP